MSFHTWALTSFLCQLLLRPHSCVIRILMWPSGGQKLMAMTPAAEKFPGWAKALRKQQGMFTKTYTHILYKWYMRTTYILSMHTGIHISQRAVRCLAEAADTSCWHKLLTILNSRLKSKMQWANNSNDTDDNHTCTMDKTESVCECRHQAQLMNGLPSRFSKCGSKCTMYWSA